MNKATYRLVFSRLGGMLVAVEETPAGTGKSNRGETIGAGRGVSGAQRLSSFAFRHIAFAALILIGTAPLHADAQIVPSGAHAPGVIQTQNGLPQVNIERPSGAGVSMNTYSQFDVQKNGAILNNSPTLVQTQQAGYVNGNPNLGPGQSARVIVNQVNSNSPSQLRGYLEVAGKRAEVVVANPNGILVDGGGFINTTRGILTTGTPLIGADGNLNGFKVTRGNIAVQGAGLNTANVDQVDLIARAVQANAAIYAKNLSVVTGANSVDHDTLAATPIAGDGPAPGVSIDVSSLGGMYANRIVLLGTENGVGVSTKGVLAAQAGDLILTTQGKLILAGQTNASGNIALSARDGIDNSGTTYSQQNVSANTSGALTNSGVLAAQQNATIGAASVASTGILGAGVNGNGSLAQSGDLSVTTGGTLAATGRSAAGRNATLSGAAVNLGGSSTSANGSLKLTANSGDLNLSGATVTAGGMLDARAAGTLTNDGGVLSSGGGQTITAGGLSNHDGQIVSGGALTENVAGSVANQGGTMQAAGALSVTAGSLDNTGGHIASLNADGLTLTTGGSLNNGVGETGAGIIGGNGNVTVQAGQIANAGSITAVQNLIATAVQTLFNGGTLAANGNINASAGTTLTNASTIAAGRTAALTGATFDNSQGTTNADQLTLHATNLANHGGSITQTGMGATTIDVTGMLDNSGGTLQTNGDSLALGPAALVNDNGTIASSGAGTLSVNVGTLSNNGGTIATNGGLDVRSGAALNRGGTLAAQTGATLNVSSLDNSAGGYVGAQTVSITDTGALNNAGGTIQADDALSVSAQSVANDGGSIANSGTGTTTVSASGVVTNTQNGLIGGNGNVSVSGGNIGNAGGTITAGGATTVQSGSTLDNRAGMIQGSGNVSAAAQGAIDNTGGQIEADGTGATLAVTGASLDNTNGRIANTGSGATTVSAAGITNSNTGGVAGAGTIGGNGDVTVNAGTLSNTNSAQLVSGHDLTLNIAQLADNTNATLSGANNVTLNGPNAGVTNAGGSVHGNGTIAVNTASFDNTSGRVGNDTGSGGSVSVNTGTLANQNGAIGSDQDLSVVTGTLTGDGRIVAGNDGAITIGSDYALNRTNQIQANHDLTFTTAGTFANQGTLGAVNALTVNAANVDNQVGADINSSNTTVNAANTITNEGRIEGDSVTMHSASLTNTAMIVGNTVTLNAGSIANTGAAAAMAAASQLNLYSPGDITNTGGANIFSLGDINIAADAARDANGVLANRANSVANDQSTIEAQGNLEIAAQTLTNTRPAPTVETVTTGVDTVHQTKRDKYVGCATTNANGKAGCSQSAWDSGYKSPATATYSGADIVSSQSGPNATERVLVVNVNGQPQTIWYNAITANSDGTVTVNYWDDYNPNVNYDPATEYATRSDGHKGYQRVEIARDTTTTTQQDQVTGPQAQQAQLLAGGNMTLANVGTLNNSFSAIAAGGSIQIGSSEQDGAIGNGSGNYGGTLVNNTGQTLYQYQKQDIVSTYAWNEDITRDVGTVVEPSIVLSPVAIGGTGGTIIANNAVQISGTDISNTNVAAANSATGATGGTLGANGTGGGLTGGGAQTVNLATGQTQTINAPQSVAGPTGALNITLPSSGLYTFNTAPGASYLVVTDPRLTSYTNFISSDYMLGQLGLDPSKTIKRLGDGVYEEQMVRNQITQLTGRVYLQGYTSNEDEYRALMNSGVHAAQEFNLVPGMALTAAQMDALTSDIVWLVSQTVALPDGSTQQVLAPVVYLAHAHANDLQPTGALIAADDVEIHATGSASNLGVIKGGTQTVISATNILNRGGSIGSSIDNGATVVSATNDVVNASGQITGNRVAVLAGHDIVNTTLVDAVGVSSVAGNSKVSQTLLGTQGTIASTGDMIVSAGNDLSVHGANITAGGDGQITAGHDITVDAVQSTTSQSVTLNDQHHWEAASTTNETSAISAGGSLAMQSGNDMTLKGATVSAGGDMAVVAGSNLTATTVTNTATYNNVATDDRTRKEVDHAYDEQAVGTSFTAGGNATLAAVNTTDASKGNVTLTGSSLTAGVTDGADNGTGAATIAATGNVTINEGREEHDSASAVESKRGSFIGGSTTDTSQNTQANIGVASLVSGDSVTVQAGEDLTIRGSNVVGTNDVKLGAVGNVNITTSQNTATQDSYYHQTQSGLMTGGLNVTIGHSSLTDTDHATSVTNNASVIGSSTGNVSITAGHDLGVTGSNVIAGGNVALTGQNVTVGSAYDTYNESQAQQFSQSGLSIGLGGGLVGLGQGMASTVRQGVQTDDSRLAAVQGVAAAEQAYQNRGAIEGAADAVTNGNASDATQGLQVRVSIGSSHTSSNASTSITRAKGSSVIGNGNVTMTATGTPEANGNAQAGTGDITMTGATVMGKNVTLDANNAITLQSAQSTEQDSSSNSSGGWNAGVALGVGKNTGFSIFANASNAHGQGNGSSVTQDDTTVAASDTLTMKSGGDTTLAGAQVSGNTAKVDVGGNLTMTSVQDTSDYANNQHSSGISGSFTFGYGGGVDLSIGHTSIDSNYASVNQQTGIVAGTGGFDVNVAGHTQLNGAEIASAAPAGSNSVTTGSFGYSDIQNSMSYSGSSEGFSLSNGPSFANTGDSARGVTQAAVSPGTITVKSGQQNGTDSTVGLSRDTANANQTVQNTFNLQQVQNNLAFAQAFGKVATTAAGQIADQLENSNPAFAEGGVARDAMHAAVAAIGAALSGGNIAGAVGGSLAGDVLQSLANPIIEQAVAQVPPENRTALRNALNEIVATAGGVAGGALTGGGSSGALAGAGAAIDNERFNRQLHPEEKTLAKQIADKSGGKYTQAQVEDQFRIMGVSVNGTSESGAPTTLIGQTPTDSGAQWISAGTTADGKPILTQVTAQGDPQLQSYILANYNSASSGQVPSQFTYALTGNSGSINLTGPFTKFDQSDADYMRNTTADTASMISTNAGRFSALTAAGAQIPSPYSAGLAGAAYAAAVAGFGADVVAQLVKPDVGQYAVSGVTGLISGELSDRVPGLGPAINETANTFNNSKAGQKTQDSLNNYWNNFVNYWSGKQ
ncbi:hemagglutinin repeat-containing protein [Paraburkholderia sp. IMGN_8]|uniref:hemagglutinin repeat-containing protein n=1 Tax=Paraburkholderia sp. IMGN_8 TaxID=3136564 RepID=UPI0031011830